MNQIQQLNNNVVRQFELKKTRKGWIGNKIKQIHLRDDIPCGLQLSIEDQYNNNFKLDLLSQEEIFIIDTFTLIHQTDIIYNSQDLKYMIILQSSIQKMKNFNPIKSQKFKHKKNSSLNKYNVFKNFVQSLQISENRKIFILADNYHKQIRVNQQNGMQIQQTKILSQNQFDDENYLINVLSWYERQIKQIGYQYLKISLLSANKNLIKRRQSNTNLRIISMLQFLYKTNSNLLDFMGFQINSLAFPNQYYQQHLEIDQAIDGVKQGKYFQGKFMNEKSYFKLGNKIYKLDLKNNRALFGDVVIIELNDVKSWKQKFVKSTIEDENFQLTQTNEINQNEIKSKSNLNQNKGLIQYLQKNTNIVPSGKVRAIYKRQQRNYCGSINAQKIIYSSKNQGMTNQNQNQKDYQIYQFVPADNKFTNFFIRTFKIQLLKNKRIIVSFDKWPTNSQYPLCHFIKTIGQIGDNKAQADTILLEHNVQIKQFTKAAYDCLPPAGQHFSIPLQELQYRLDLRGIDVVSIDPPGCKDIDDALHCITLPNGNFQIGVHIADVSYYVRPDSALDLQARNRCTTVYLVDRRTDMLPKLLTQNLCSLRANVDRLAFSTIWQIDQNATIINTKYCKTIIRSRMAFTYMQAQELMQSKDKGNIAQSIRNLNIIAKKLKQKRIDQGALTLASTQVKITLEEQTHSATDVQMYQMVETNHLIEEFMLLANIAVAEKIYERFPALSILRRHTSPKVNDLQTLKEIMNKFGYQFKYETSRDLADSLNAIVRSQDEFFNRLVRIMTTRCMNQATYFCSADYDIRQFYHYGLAAPFYTHFTSPIRRYADVLVHRLLVAAIDLEPLPNFMINKLKMTKVCQQMNMRNRMARYASRASSDYHTYQFFKGKQQIQKAILTAIQQQSITIMLIKYGLQSKITFSKEQIQQTKQLNQGNGIFFKAKINNRIYQLFNYLDVQVNVQLKGFHKIMKLNIL